MSGSRPADPHQASAGSRQFLTRDFVLIWIASFAGFASFYLIQQPTLPLYVQHLGGSPSTIGWVAGAFSITTLALRPFVGRLVDAAGRRALVIVGGVVFVLCAPLYAAVGTIAPLLILQLVRGGGMAFYTTASNTYATDLAPDRRRAELIGYFGIANNLALGLGPLTASLLLAHGAAFSTVFVIAAAVAAVVVLAMLVAHESPHRRVRVRGWAWDTFINRRALAPSGLMFSVAVTYGALTTFIAAYTVDQGLGRGAVAWFWGVYSVTLIVVRLFSGRIADRFGRPAAIIPGLVMVAGAMWVVAALNGLIVLAAAAALFAAGFGFVYPALLALTVDRVGSRARGTAMATFSASFDVGIGGGAMLFGVVADHLGYATMYSLVGLAPVGGLILYASRLMRRSTERDARHG